LAGHAYSKICDEGRSYSTDFDVLLDVLELMPDYIRYSYGLYFVPNPSMPEENFAEKWNVEESRKGEKLRKNFELWHKTITENIIEIASSVGEDQLLDNLSKYFGERPVKAVREAMVGGVNAARDSNDLRVLALTGALSAGAANVPAMARTVPENTFYGGNALSSAPVKKNTFFGD
ncbi:nucleotidyltransferase domain-containing protein, partial [Klebsiella pneumoniae]